MRHSATLTNDFLDPLFERLRQAPEARFGSLYNAGRWESASFAAFMERAARFTTALFRSGIEPGDVVPVILRHDLNGHAAFLGAMLAGAVPSYLPYPNVKADHRLYWDQHRKVFAHIRPKAIVVYDELAGAIERCVADLGSRVIAESATVTTPPAKHFVTQQGDATALLQHSSGTTGLKKGVALSYNAVVRQLQAYGAAVRLGETPEPVIASWLPLYHDMGLVSSFLLPLWSGIQIIGIDPFEWVAKPGLLLEAVERYRATHAWLPNFAFLHLVRAVPRSPSYDLSSLVALTSCSEPCKPAAFDRFLERFGGWGIGEAVLQTCYAMAETVFAVSQSETGATPRRLTIERSSIEAFGPVQVTDKDGVTLLSNGPPISGCTVRVVRGIDTVGESEVGELAVKSDYMFSGYFRNEAATASALSDGWYRTGDIGFIDEGEVYIVGRLKDIIIVNGKNVFAHDIEAALHGLPGVKAGRAVAFGHYSDRVGSEQLIVVAERLNGEANSTDIIMDANNRVLAAVGVPCAEIRLVEQGWLVKTTSGKISRSENARKYAKQFRALE